MYRCGLFSPSPSRRMTLRHVVSLPFLCPLPRPVTGNVTVTGPSARPIHSSLYQCTSRPLYSAIPPSFPIFVLSLGNGLLARGCLSSLEHDRRLPPGRHTNTHHLRMGGSTWASSVLRGRALRDRMCVHLSRSKAVTATAVMDRTFLLCGRG